MLNHFELIEVRRDQHLAGEQTGTDEGNNQFGSNILLDHVLRRELTVPEKYLGAKEGQFAQYRGSSIIRFLLFLFELRRQEFDN